MGGRCTSSSWRLIASPLPPTFFTTTPAMSTQTVNLSPTAACRGTYADRRARKAGGDRTGLGPHQLTLVPVVDGSTLEVLSPSESGRYPRAGPGQGHRHRRGHQGKSARHRAAHNQDSTARSVGRQGPGDGHRLVAERSDAEYERTRAGRGKPSSPRARGSTRARVRKPG